MGVESAGIHAALSAGLLNKPLKKAQARRQHFPTENPKR
jgi:hypothetical protein